MLDRFFRPRWDSTKSHNRVQALLRMAPADPLIALMASSDSEPLVRREAVNRLDDLRLLCDIARRDLDQQVRDCAWDRFIIMMEVPVTSELELHHRLQLLKEVSLATILTRIIRSQSNIGIKLAAVAALNDEMHLEEIALHSSIAALRHAAAERIESESILKSLMLDSRNRDKNVYRIARERLDQFEQQRRTVSEQEKAIRTLQEQIQQLYDSTFHPLYQARFDYLHQRWLSLGTHDPATEYLLQGISQRCQNHWQQEHAAEIWRQNVAHLQQHLGESPDYDRLLPWMIELQESAELILNLPKLSLEQEDIRQNLLNRLTEIQEWWYNWQQLEAQAAVAQPNNIHLQKNDLLRIAPFNSQCLLLDAPEIAVAVKEDATCKIPDTDSANTVSEPARITSEPVVWTPQLLESLERIEHMIEEGHSELAIRLWMRFPRQVQTPEYLRQRLHQVEYRLREWKDWQSYAVLPKKEQLLQKMVQLRDAELPPAELWKAERQLHRQWRELGVADHHAEFPLWQEFSTIGAQIRIQCQSWREEQKQKQLAAEQDAQKLLKQLQSLSIHSADSNILNNKDVWKNLRDDLVQAQATWKTLRTRFKSDHILVSGVRAELDRLQHSIHAEELANRRKMESLVQQTENLLQQTTQATHLRHQIKSLQQQWKEIGIHRHKDNQTLWPRFKIACDRIYAFFQDQQMEIEAQIHQLSADQPDFQQKFSALKEVAKSYPVLQPEIRELEHKAQQHQDQQRQKSRQKRIDRIISLVFPSVHEDCTGSVLNELPLVWRQKPETAELLTTKDAMLILEAVLNLDSPPELQEQRNHLLLTRWTRGQNQQQIKQDLTPVLIQQILLYPLEEEGFIRRLRLCLECALP